VKARARSIAEGRPRVNDGLLLAARSNQTIKLLNIVTSATDIDIREIKDLIAVGNAATQKQRERVSRSILSILSDRLFGYNQANNLISYEYFLNAKVTLCPPKPKELDRATSTVAARLT
jgi:myo-inositol catabolism protein IolC